jgi:predicted RNA binding protein YcfA (HicA-like mRNA interferase family)
MGFQSLKRTFLSRRSRLPRESETSGRDEKEVARIAQRLGFKFRRQTGSHAIYVCSEDHHRVVIPMHAGRDLKPKTLRGIIEDLGLTVEEFQRML